MRAACESPEKMWKSTRWSRDSTPKQVVLPPLKNEVTDTKINDSKGKADILLQSFFPPPVQADLDDLATAEYPPPICLGSITREEIRRVIQAVPAKKAPGCDGIPNAVLKLIQKEIAPVLYYLFNSSLNLGYYPAKLKESITVVLRKPEKKDYSDPKAYRPIALLNTLGKLLESILANRISAIAERYDLLPNTHMGGRRLRSTDHAIHYLLERTSEAWRQGKVASLLLLDVTGAFDKVSHPRLIADLRRKRLDDKIIKWIASFLTNRSTELVIPGYRTDKRAIDIGIPQGSPLSPILFLFYNAEILEICQQESQNRISATGFIDDIALLAVGDSTEETCKKLEDVHEKACMTWAKKHGAQFAPKKYHLLHLTRRKCYDLQHKLALSGQEISPEQSVKYLGVLLDSKLRWSKHIEYTRTKATKSVGAMARLAGSTWGGSYSSLRKIYQAIVIPQITYACSTWAYRKKSTESTWEKFRSIQGKAARVITGAYRMTSLQALDIEACLSPIGNVIQETALLSALRIYVSPLHTKLKARERGKSYRSELDFTSPLKAWTTILKEKFIGEKKLEGFQSNIVMPDWLPPSTSIQSREQTRKTVEKLEGKKLSTCYTDGSGIAGKIGAACVLMSQSFGSYLGTDDDYTVYAAELTGIFEALSTIYSRTNVGPQTWHIFTDNQAAIQTIKDPGSRVRSGQIIVQGIVQKLDALRWRGAKVIFYWIPAHEGFPGNEIADQEAKKATGWRLQDGKGVNTSDTAKEAYYSGLRLITKVRYAIKRHYQQDWAKQWAEAKHGSDLRRICSAPTKEVISIRQGATRVQSSLITQLRTGKIGLASFLFSRKVPGIESAQCPLCKREDQTVGHVLLRCPILQKRRNEMWKAIDKSDHWNRPSLEVLLTRYAKQAAKFIQDTRLLRQY